MPVTKCENNKWRIGAGACIYPTKEKAMEVWTAILAQDKYQAKKQNELKKNTEKVSQKMQ